MQNHLETIKINGGISVTLNIKTAIPWEEIVQIMHNKFYMPAEHLMIKPVN